MNTIKKYGLHFNNEQKELICDAINVYGNGQHPVAELDNFEEFGVDYVYECLRKFQKIFNKNASVIKPKVSELVRRFYPYAYTDMNKHTPRKIVRGGNYFTEGKIIVYGTNVCFRIYFNDEGELLEDVKDILVPLAKFVNPHSALEYRYVNCVNQKGEWDHPHYVILDHENAQIIDDYE